jgi:ADP-heptose:LPS heptosyltransferase
MDRILVINMSTIGDILQSTPTLRGLRRKYPKAHISFLVYDSYLDVIQGNKRVDEIFVFERKRYRSGLLKRNANYFELAKDILNFVQMVKGCGIDLIVNLHNTNLSAILTYLLRPNDLKGFTMNKYGMYFGTEGWGEYLYKVLAQKEERRRNPYHIVDLYARVAEVELDSDGLELAIHEDDILFGDGFIRDQGIRRGDLLIGVVPGSGWPSKRWMVERFAELIDRLVERLCAKVIVFGGKGDEEVGKRLNSLTRSRFINAITCLSVKQLGAVMRHCRVVVSNDSGPMHVASAVGVSVVGIFGPTSSRERGPVGVRNKVFDGVAECSPCFKDFCKDPVCFDPISVDKVLSAVEELI